MTSRTPIRLTHYRGPLATPSASPESSPTSSTPPTDISQFSPDIRPTLDVAILQLRISPPSPPTRYQYMSRLYRRRREVSKQGLFGRRTHLSQLGLLFKSLVCSAGEPAKTLAWAIMFCLFIWGLLEWSSYASELPRQPSPQISTLRFPFPSYTRALRCHVNASSCEPKDQHAAVLQFLSEQIQHAKALSSLSVSLGLPLRAFFEAYRATIPRVIIRHNSTEPTPAQQTDSLANLTDFLDPSLLDFTSGSFVGRSFTLALEELDDLISEHSVSHGSSTHGEHQEVHLHAIYWRTASNLLLEYSAARPRARRLLQHLHALHQQLPPWSSVHHAAGRFEGRLKIWWWNTVVRHPAAPFEDGMPALATGLEVTLDNVRRLIAYLDWITEQLAQTTLRDVLKTQHRTDFASCMISLQELFAQSRPSTSRKLCFCLNDYGIMQPNRPERVEIMVPGSPTVRAER